MAAISYSGLQLFDKCPRAFRDKYYRGVKGEEKKSPAMARGSRLHEAAEDYVRGDTLHLPPEIKHKEKMLDRLVQLKAIPEMEFNLTQAWDNIPFEDTENGNIRGMIDCIANTGDVLEIYEYKTGKKYDSHADQRSLYTLAGFILYPEAKVCRTSTVYFDLGGADETLAATRDQLAVFQMTWAKRINATRPPREYIARPGRHCAWCASNQANGGDCAAGK